MLRTTLKQDLAVWACQAHGMSDADIASFSLRICRNVSGLIAALPAEDISDDERSVLNTYFSDLMPEVCSRAFARSNTSTAFARISNSVNLSDAALRIACDDISRSDEFAKLRSISDSEYSSALKCGDLQLATTSMTNGNILNLTLDRIALPDQSSEVFQVMRLAASVRGTSTPDGSWVPSMARELLMDSNHPINPDVVDAIIEGRDDLDLPDLDYFDEVELGELSGAMG